jgi:hypothetical protein
LGSALSLLRGPATLEAQLETTAEKTAKLRSVQVVTKGFEPLLEYADDSTGFCKDILGVTLTEIQKGIAESVRDNPRTSVAACYASGKTFLAACLLLWWLFTRRPAMVVTTAPTKRQVEKLLWRYVRKLFKKARRRLHGRLLTCELKIDEDQLAFGFTGSSGHAVQGIHEAENVLFIEDEAAGMEAAILEDFEGITTGEGSRHLKIGNPTSDSGPFFDSQETPRVSKNWVPFNISAFDIVNVIKKANIVPGLVTWEWVKRIRDQYGEDSPFWITKVLGKFCRTAGEKVISSAWRDLAKERYATASTTGLRILGCDIGRTIDESVFVLLEGQSARVVGRMQCDDLTLIADEIERLSIEHDVDRVNIDGTGLGIGVCDTIRRRRTDGESPIPDTVNVNYCVLGRGADDKEIFAGILDEIFWRMRKAFDPKNPDAIAINPDDEQLCEQVCWRGYSLQKGKYKVWTKKETRKEYGSSPDDGDALMLCFWEPDEAYIL